MEHQDTYLICQLADSFNEQTDTEMCSVAIKDKNKASLYSLVKCYQIDIDI